MLYGLLKPLPLSTEQILYIHANIPMQSTHTSIFRESKTSVFSHAAAYVKLRHIPAAYFITSFHTLQTERLPAR